MTTAPRRASIWPAVEERILDLIQAHRSTIVFVNARRGAERLCARLNELALERATGGRRARGRRRRSQSGRGDGPVRRRRPASPPVVARAHHGSVSREERKHIEEALKAGDLPAVVATSSLELGIDMGAVDLVVQVEAPPSVAAGLQRVGRAGHQVGAVSRGVVFPKHRGDLVSCAVVADRMATGGIEELRYPRNPLDVLAQQIVAMVAMEPWHVDRPGRAGPPGGAVRRAARVRARRRARHALRALPVDRVRRAAPATRLGPRRRPAHRPARRPAPGRHQRRHHPRPRPVRRVPGRLRAGGPGRRTRRGDGLRVARRRRVPARLDVVADRGHHARPGARLARARARRRGCRSGRATRSAARSSWAARSAPSCAS